jgi:hypothetical protein
MMFAAIPPAPAICPSSTALIRFCATIVPNSAAIDAG